MTVKTKPSPKRRIQKNKSLFYPPGIGAVLLLGQRNVLTDSRFVSNRAFSREPGLHFPGAGCILSPSCGFTELEDMIA